MKASWWKNDVKVGIVVLIGLILLVVLILWAARWHPSSNAYEVRIRFDNVGGLLKNAPVSMHGMEIGQVKSIELMGNWVQVTAKIDQNIQITDGYRILVDIVGLVGEKYVEIINGPSNNSVTKDDPLLGISAPSIGNLLIDIKDGLAKASETFTKTQDFIDTNSDDVKSGINDIRKFILATSDTMESALQNLDIMMTRINRLTDFKEGDIAKTISEIRIMVTELNKERERMSPIVNSFVKNLDQMTADASPALSSSMENLKKSSEDMRSLTAKLDKNVGELSDSISKIVGKIDNTADDSSEKIQETLVDLGRASALMNNILDRADYIVTEVEKGNGTIGKLIKEDDGYEKINEVMTIGKKALVNADQAFVNANKAITDFNRATKDLNSWRLQLFGDVKSIGEYELSYNHLSGTLQNQLRLSVLPSMPYTYIGGIFMKDDDIKYDIQVGRRFGQLTIRGGFIRSIAGIGLDYWAVPNRLLLSVEGVNITTKEPEIGIDASIRMFNNWYLMFGADAINVNKSGLSAGIRAIYK